MKYTITMSCGHEVVVDLIGPGADREKKIKYYEAYGLCKECYKKNLEKSQKEVGLCFDVSATSKIDYKTGEPLINLYFYGDTMPHKEEIKALGYMWGYKEKGEYYSYKKPGEYSPAGKFWNKTIKISLLEEELEKVKPTGVEIPSTEQVKKMAYRYTKSEVEEWKERKEKIESLPKPERPEILEGGNWNGTVYGGNGKACIYLNSKKISVTDEQATELRKYAEDMEAYKRKLNEIKLP